MHSLKLRQTSGFYFTEYSSSEKLLLLGEFLATSVVDFDYIKKDLANPESDYNMGMCVAERHNDNVTINHLYATKMPEFTIPYDKFMKLIDDWLEAVCKHDLPKKILITMDDQFNFKVHPFDDQC